MKKQFVALALMTALLLCACTAPAVEAGPGKVIDLTVPTTAPSTPSLAPRATPSLAPTLAPTPVPEEPQNAYVTLGAVGDIMMMQSQVTNAWSKALGAYDFTPSFRGMADVFKNVDIACANLETPIAGAEALYSGLAPAKPTPDENGAVPRGEFQTFNAPDELAKNLKASGFTLITTANNHCLDRGAAGVYHTANVLREAGLMQTGTFTSQQDRAQARIMDVNGIKIGLIAWTTSVNMNEGMLSSSEHAYAVARAREDARVKEDIRVCHEAGAEFIVAFLHWDEEFMDMPTDSTRNMAKRMLTWGVDAIIGAHPHVVQPVEYITVERKDGPYTGLVAYSLGNFLSNMSPSPRDYGMYLQLTIEKTPQGEVRLFQAGMLPVYCIKHRVDGRTLHEVLPAYEDTSAISGDIEITAEIRDGLRAARAHVMAHCGDIAPIA